MKPPTLCDPVAPSALYISAVVQSLANNYSTKEQLDAYACDRGRSEKYHVKIVQQESWMGQQVSKVSVAINLRVTGSLFSLATGSFRFRSFKHQRFTKQTKRARNMPIIRYRISLLSAFELYLYYSTCWFPISRNSLVILAYRNSILARVIREHVPRRFVATSRFAQLDKHDE